MKKKKDAEKLETIDITKIRKREERKKSRLFEILRFLVTGGICTLIDAGLFFILMKFVFNGLASLGGENGYGGYLAWGISTTISFLASCFVNFFLSRLWVYQNVDKKVNTKTQKAFWTYVGLAALGWLLGLGIQEAGVLLCNSFWPELKLSINFVKVSLGDLWNEAGLAFWAFVVIFVIKTCITLVYNYLTRKHIIFKAPKKEENAFANPDTSRDMVVTLTPMEQKKKTTEQETPTAKNNLTTKESFHEILHEEIENTFGKGQKKVAAIDAKKIIREEIENYEKKHGRNRGE
ncbi:MAG TPA: hypothetical protein DD384_00455 [Firmicutes bacterium]|nr:hypothetical protein [Bacillota bacterium]